VKKLQEEEEKRDQIIEMLTKSNDVRDIEFEKLSEMLKKFKQLIDFYNLERDEMNKDNTTI
jgi:hypothetical protein